MLTIMASIFASTMLVSSTFAATPGVPLPAGQPAGVKQAAYMGDNNFLLILLGAGIVIGGIALAVSNPGGDTPTTPTTSSTTTTTTTTTATATGTSS